MKLTKRTYDLGLRATKMAETRARILDAATEIYMTADISAFTLEEVARRASVSVQTVIRAHESREQLFFTMLDKMARAGVPLKPTEPGDAVAAVAAIVDLYETSGDMILKWLAEEQRSPRLKATLDEGRADHMAWVRKAFDPQLDRASPAGRERLFHSLVAATDVQVWAKLRKDCALTRPEAEAVILNMIQGVIGREERNG